MHDVKFILDYLAQRGDIDMNRIGMFGEGSGGAIAILAAASDPRIKAIDVLNPWGDWPNFLAKSPVVTPDPNRADYVKPEFLKKVAALDPVKYLPKLTVPVRIQQVHQNEITPMEAKESITAAAPPQAEILRFEANKDLSTREGHGRLFEWMRKQLGEPGNSGSSATGSSAAGKPTVSQAAPSSPQ